MILLDTHVVVWPAPDSTRLSRAARAAIDEVREQGDGLAISDITPLELVALVNKGRIRLDVSLESFFREIEARFVVLPITARACALTLGLPAAYPKDPLDRVIGATAACPWLRLTGKSAKPRRFARFGENESPRAG